MTEHQERKSVELSDAPLGMESEFPQYVWVIFAHEPNDQLFITSRRDGETFASCFQTLQEAQALIQSNPPPPKKRRWPFKPAPYQYSFEEWSVDEFAQTVKNSSVRDLSGALIRGLALLDGNDRFLMKRYLR